MTWSNVLRGVAIGDAWGWPNEFKSIEDLVKDNPQSGGGVPGSCRKSCARRARPGWHQMWVWV
jgi:hypothetical protein